MDRPGGWPRGRLLLAWLLLIGGAVFLGSFLAALFLGLLLDFRFGLRTGALLLVPAAIGISLLWLARKLGPLGEFLRSRGRLARVAISVASVPVALVMFFGILVAWFVLGSVIQDLHLLEPRQERFEQVLGIEVPDDAEDYDAWQEVYFDGSSDYRLTFSIPRADLPELLDGTSFQDRLERGPAVELRVRVDDVEDWATSISKSGLVSPPGRAKLVVDLDDPERAVIYAYT